jgi:hypothetical protein
VYDTQSWKYFDVSADKDKETTSWRADNILSLCFFSTSVSYGCQGYTLLLEEKRSILYFYRLPYHSKLPRVDLLGFFYPHFIDSYFKHEPKVAAKFVLDRLEPLLPIRKTILFMDGNQSVEKNVTAQQRLIMQVGTPKSSNGSYLQQRQKLLRDKECQSAKQMPSRDYRRNFRFISDMMQTFIDTASTLEWKL